MYKSMAFYKKVLMKIRDKDGNVQELWHPRSILVGKPVTTDQLAKRVSAESTVARADVKAVLEALSGVMGDYMASGRSVRLDGIGSFYFASTSVGNGVDSPDKVNANMINGVRVRFIPETTFRRSSGGTQSGSGRHAVRPLTDCEIEWIDIAPIGVSGRDDEETDEVDESLVNYLLPTDRIDDAAQCYPCCAYVYDPATGTGHVIYAAQSLYVLAYDITTTVL